MSSADTYDVVIVGSGLAGLAAALACTDMGLSTVVLEEAPRFGGGTSFSFGAVWVGDNSLARAAGLDDDRSATLAYMRHAAAGHGEAARMEAFVDGAPLALDVFRQAGVPLELMAGVNDQFYGKTRSARAEGRTLQVPPFPGRSLGSLRDKLQTPHGDAWRLTTTDFTRLAAANAPAELQRRLQAAVADDDIAQGAGLIAYALRALADRDVTLLTQAAAARLLTHEGRVSGVETRDGRRFGAAQAVVLACGGYESNPDMVAQFEDVPGIESCFPATITGDGLRMAAAVGGAVHLVRNNLSVMLGYRDPDAVENAHLGAAAIREMTRAHTLVVNQDGRRFGNEASFQEMAPALRHYDQRRRRHVNLPCWLIFDAQYLERWGFAGSPAGRAPAWVERADTLEGLARRMGIDADGLAGTIKAFNHYAKTGVDDEFGRRSAWSLAPAGGSGPNPSLGAVDTPPFFAAPMCPTLTGATGLAADACARVLDWSGQAIDGLYAVGNAAAHTEYGSGYQAGHSLSSAMTFALIAARDIAHRAGTPVGLARAS